MYLSHHLPHFPLLYFYTRDLQTELDLEWDWQLASISYCSHYYTLLLFGPSDWRPIKILKKLYLRAWECASMVLTSDTSIWLYPQWRPHLEALPLLIGTWNMILLWRRDDFHPCELLSERESSSTSSPSSSFFLLCIFFFSFWPREWCANSGWFRLWCSWHPPCSMFNDICRWRDLEVAMSAKKATKNVRPQGQKDNSVKTLKNSNKKQYERHVSFALPHTFIPKPR